MIIDFGKKKRARKEQKEFESKTEALLEDWGIDEKDMFEPPPPPPTMEQLANIGLTGSVAQSYLYIFSYLTDEACQKDLEAGFEFASNDKDALFERMQIFPEFHQGVSDILFAIASGKIKPRFEGVKKKLPLLTQRLFNRDVSGFWTAVNELKNIAAGMGTF